MKAGSFLCWKKRKVAKQVAEQTRFADVLQRLLYLHSQLFKVMAEKVREGNFCNNRSHQERCQVFCNLNRFQVKHDLLEWILYLYSGHIMYKFLRLQCNMTCYTLLPEKYKLWKETVTTVKRLENKHSKLKQRENYNYMKALHTNAYQIPATYTSIQRWLKNQIQISIGQLEFWITRA